MNEIDLSEFRRPAKAVRCKVQRAIDSLSEADQKKISAALETPDITSRMIHEFLTRRNLEMTYSSVPIHRSGRCSCG